MFLSGAAVALCPAMHSPALVSRIRSEFLEMPGLQLTMAQAARLWNLEPRACRDVIEALVDSAFLRWTARGTIVRTDTSFRAPAPVARRQAEDVAAR
jgi:hypothetical protein